MDKQTDAETAAVTKMVAATFSCGIRSKKTMVIYFNEHNRLIEAQTHNTALKKQQIFTTQE